jgi:competence protein ComEA
MVATKSLRRSRSAGGTRRALSLRREPRELAAKRQKGEARMKKGSHRVAGLFTLLALLTAMAPALPAAEGGAVNLNTATEEELVALPGIGPSKAKAIIEYRSAHPFQSVEELKNVRGIGDHMFQSLKDKIQVGAAAASAGSTKR